MSTVYLFILVLVTCFLLAIPLFPFWKVWRRMKTHHPEIWARGPFDIMTMLSKTENATQFLDIVKEADHSKILVREDPEFVKWALIAQDVIKMLPKKFWAQVGCALVFLYFVAFFSTVIMSFLRA